ncbi:single-stranded-DNA-specific exonuclease RecJ [Hydrogenimonas sp.]
MKGRSTSMEGLPLLTKEKIEAILRARFDDGFKNLQDLPNPSDFHDMDRAADRIARAIEKKERIVIVGDYDVDGVVSTALMEEFFEIVGYQIQSLIPNRFRDGYGISPKIVDRIEADLIVTVDNGITAVEAAKRCKARGIDLIVTDHHTPSEILPDAFAIVNPKKNECGFAYPEICGAQVAWFLVGALKQRLGIDLKMGRFLDLLALAIVADVMPLLSINRPLVQRGLEMLSVSKRPAFEAVRAHLGKNRFTAEDVAFGIAPRLNSAGRMEDASLALRFLRAGSLNEASGGWLALDTLNQRRRRVEAEITEAAMAQADPADPVVVVAGEGWHEGVVGIVASRLVERFGKPAIVLSVDGGMAKGSGRSVGDVDLFALLEASRERLAGFGGHRMAAGLSVETDRIEGFRKTICAHAEKLDSSSFDPKESVLGELPLREVDWELMEILNRYEPYGAGNGRPKFLLRDIDVVDIRTMGSEHRHLGLSLASEKFFLDAVQFNFTQMVSIGQKIDLLGTFQINEFNGNRKIQLFVDKILR